MRQRARYDDAAESNLSRVVKFSLIRLTKVARLRESVFLVLDQSRQFFLYEIAIIRLSTLYRCRKSSIYVLHTFIGKAGPKFFLVVNQIYHKSNLKRKRTIKSERCFTEKEMRYETTYR
jgi:hypothetical protein